MARTPLTARRNFRCLGKLQVCLASYTLSAEGRYLKSGFKLLVVMVVAVMAGGPKLVSNLCLSVICSTAA